MLNISVGYVDFFLYVYDFALLLQNFRPYHISKCHVGSKANMAGKKNHKMNLYSPIRKYNWN
jgi:hypothetical protein